MRLPEIFEFEALAKLREQLAVIGRKHDSTMAHFVSDDRRGFRHQSTGSGDASTASTATCVSALIRADRWDSLGPDNNRLWGTSQEVAKLLIKKLDALLKPAEGPKGSGGLPPKNPFSFAFIAEAILDLSNYRYPGYCGHGRIIQEKIVPFLEQEIMTPDSAPAAVGAVRMKPYPPSAYLTQLTFRVLRRSWGAERTEITQCIRVWARAEVNRQIALITTDSRIADPMQLAYAIILVSSTSTAEHVTPEEKALSAAGLRIFFSKQQDDGSWPSSQPLFHYPTVGNAQCFEYELLTQMLICRPLQNELLNYFRSFQKAVSRLDQAAFQLRPPAPGPEVVGWASGHHPQIAGPESWSTACVFDFCHTLGRLVAEAVRLRLFAEVSSEYSPPVPIDDATPDTFGKDFLDADLVFDGRPRSLTETLLDTFVKPIKKDRTAVANGGRLKKETPMSAILFGPPGTSKTELAKKIAKCIGWPLLSVDPSYLVQDGLDHLYSRANKLFSMLAVAEEVVAFLDEFDEMGRERTDNTDISSRFITTAMLPKLAAINKSRQIVIILATNYIANFDAAFSRGGRFDMIVQVMTPKAEEKFRTKGWDVLKAVIDDTPEANRLEAKTAVGDLTYTETTQLVARLKQGDTDKLQELLKAANGGTLARRHGPEGTWKSVSVKQQEHIRLPGFAEVSREEPAATTAELANKDKSIGGAVIGPPDESLPLAKPQSGAAASLPERPD